MECVLEKVEEDGTYVLRNEYNSPNIDTVIYAQCDKKLKVGEFYNVKITDLEGIDLKGEIL
jgi:ribosomal protein S12 methylthiotransferase